MKNTTETKKTAVERLTSASEVLFLALTAVYLLFLTAGITTFNIPFPAQFEQALLAAMAGAALLRAALFALRGRAEWPRLAVGALLAGLYMLVYRSDGYAFLRFLAVMTVGLVGIDYRRVLKVYAAAVGLLVAAAVIAALSGAIINFVFMKDGHIRSAWGIIYPTDFASSVLFALLAVWVAWKKLPDWAMLLFALALTLLAWCIVRSTTVAICGGAFALLVLYRMFEAQVIERRGRLKWIGAGVDWLATLAFALLACAMFGLMVLYRRDVGLAHRANNLLSGRLKLAVNCWRQNGVKAFGVPFEQIGAGGSTFQARGYNFVDSSYPLILIRYGWATLVALAAMWTLGVRRAIRIGDRRLVLTMALIAFHSFSEHHFTEVNYNILLAMPLAAYAAQPAPAKKAPRAKGAAWAWAATGAVCAGLALLVPLALSLLRTTFQALDICGGGKRSLAVIAAILCALAVVAGFVRALHRLLAALFAKEALPRRALAALAACAVLAGGVALACDRLGRRAERDNADLLEAERPALEAVTASAEGRVYSDALPEVYRRRFGGISRAPLSGEDLARLYGVTVVMENWRECNPFFQSGFLYARISDVHSIYTNDVGAIAGLKAAGYRLTGYYSDVRQADMQLEADINNLEYTPDGLEIEGIERALASGPFVDLYEGRYTVRYDLRLSPSVLADASIRPDDVVCQLGVTSYYGEEVLLTKDVPRKRFGDDGALAVEVPFEVDGCRGVEFQAYAIGECPVTVEAIGWRRTPNYDIHAYYDADRRKVRDEIYTLEGEPALTKRGYFACEYGYDADGNRCLIRYFGQDGAPVMVKEGYAERRRTFNVKRQLVREEYYGTDGRPILLKKGYAAVERGYDADGNVASRRYFGLDGEPTAIRAGYAEIRRTYNANRKVVREAYFDADGEPVLSKRGYAAVEREYDAAGNATLLRYIGVDGGATTTSGGYAEVRRTYNGMRQITRSEYYGADGQLIALKKGYAILERDYDDAGNCALERYYGADGQPTVIPKGYAEVRRTYNDKRKLTRAEYYGADGQLINLKKGYAILERDYDDAGKLVARRWYDASGKLVRKWRRKKKK